MKNKILKPLFFFVVMATLLLNFSIDKSTSFQQVNLLKISSITTANAEPTGDGSCGTGYAYFCGYIYGIPYFPVFEGPWLA